MPVSSQKARGARKPRAKRRPSLPSAPERGEAHALVASVAKVSGFAKKLDGLGKEGDPIVLDHVSPHGFAFAVALALQHLESVAPGRRVWILCADPKHQDQLHAELTVWQTHALYYPRMSAAELGGDTMQDPDVAAERLSVLTRWVEDADRPNGLVLCSDSLDEPAPQRQDIELHRRAIAVGDTMEVEAFLDELSKNGYERVPVVTERGQFARRGGIVDFYSWQAEEPLRLEFLDEEVESIRAFDLHNQASVKRLERASLVLRMAGESEDLGKLRDHLRADDLVVAVDCEPDVPVHLRIMQGTVARDGPEEFTTAIHENPLGVFDASDFVLSETRRQQFDRQVGEWIAGGWRVVVFFHNEAERERFHELWSGADKPPIETTLGLLFRGLTIPAAKLAVLTGAEIFGRHQAVRRVRGSKLDEAQVLRKARDYLRDLRAGDLVVHADHGIGKYVGIEIREGARREEVLVIRYADQARVFVPVAQAHLVTRYVGVGGKAPPLSKLGGARWQLTRKNAEKSVEEFAARMLSISAERTALSGFAHPPDTKWQAEFEQSFLYQETADQLRCVEEIKADMEKPKPMDRLLCADVGFGKTEIAIRAAFKAVMGGKQVAVLVPTTVLARQHWATFRERMSEFPVTVEMLCRLTPKDREKPILQGIRDGTVDIVIGTHRLISKDVRYKDLGLVVIDEEQRFGVKHKERFKEVFRLIDVLTLSATPIPRTLYLALMGMRDMSTIETPPPNRNPVITNISPYDERLIRTAIDAEIDRGGQVFFLHNRVKSIHGVAKRIEELCPRAKALVGHGQMDKELLEDVMHRFVEGDADVLVATTIIESGVDIPNANTIIIDRADRFGLADLYQLRGRVGRSGIQAHAHLMLPRDFVTGGDARKRVNAIKQYSGLGSGFKIALRDLEIRGAGNLLGTEQSGHIAAVGFDLYCQMLKQSVNRLEGKRVSRPVDVALRADFLVLNESQMPANHSEATPAFIPSSFVEDAQLRITAYRQLAEVMTRRELDELETQWQDQFGERLPHAMRNLLTCGAIRLAAAHAGINEVEIEDQKLKLSRNGKFVMLNAKFPRLTVKPGHQQLAQALKMLRAF